MTPAESKRVEEVAARLAEDWEVVQILVSRAEHDGTGRYFYGIGNWFARQGMADDFVKSENARLIGVELEKVINPEESL